MSCLYEFKELDIFYNQIEATPKQEFFVFNSSVYYNKKSLQSGAYNDSVVSPTGTISLFELNVDRNSSATGLIYPFIYKTDDYIVFRDIVDKDYYTQYGPSAEISGTYPLTSSATRQFFATDSSRKRITSLKNTLNYYTPKSAHYSFNSSLGDKATQQINLISIPNIS